LLVLHLATVLWKGSFQEGQGHWIRLTCLLPLGLLLLFTGYVLRGDATGQAAGAIAEHIASSVPWAGDFLDALFFDLSQAGWKKVYAQHLVGLPLAGLILAWPHLVRYSPRWRHLPLLLLSLLALSAWLPAPMEPERPGMVHIAGPWFFLGLQELLRVLPPLAAGVAYPATILPLLFAANPQRKRHRLAVALLVAWLAVYLALSLAGYLRNRDPFA